MSRPRQQPGCSREWTDFEINIVVALICKGDHLTSNRVEFTTKINEALSGKKLDNYEGDISVADVQQLMSVMERNKKAAFAFVERQPHPHVLTRSKKRAFQRDIPFDGSLKEWLQDGRKERFERAKQTVRGDGIQSTFTNIRGAQVERWMPSSHQRQAGETDPWSPDDSFITSSDASRGWRTRYEAEALQTASPALTMPGGSGASPSRPSTPTRGHIDPILAQTPFGNARPTTDAAEHGEHDIAREKYQDQPYLIYGGGWGQQAKTLAGVGNEKQGHQTL